MGCSINLNEVAALAEALGSRALKGVPLSKYTSFKVGGPCGLMLEPHSIDAVSVLLKAVDERKLNKVFLGRASNVLVSDGGFDGVVFHMASAFSKITFEGNYIDAEAGVPLSKLCWQAYKNSLSGLEFAWGIPGSLGGALYMNAGAYDGEMCQVVESVTALDPMGNVVTLSNEELGFSYRHSVFAENDRIILGCRLKLTPAPKEGIRAKMDDLMGRRMDKQPLEYPSAGSFFKRPHNAFAGKLIEDCGLKGLAVGGAQVSNKHSGFLINRGGATFQDVMELAKIVRGRVFEHSGIYLEMEPKILSETGWMEEGKQWL